MGYILDQFQYDPLKDVYLCPTGTVMPCRAKHTKRRSMEYRAPRKACVVQNIQVLLSRIRPSIQAAAKAMTVPTKKRKCRYNYLSLGYLGLDVMQIGHFFETGVIDSICFIVGCNQLPQMAGC